MSVSISFSDFLAVEKLSWKLFRSFKKAPSEFRAELFSLYIVLFQLYEDSSNQESFFAKARKESPTYLTMAIKGCKTWLGELHKLLEENPQSEWKTIEERFANSGNRLASHRGTITGLLQSLGNSTLPQLERIGYSVFERLERTVENHFVHAQTVHLATSNFLSQLESLEKEKQEFMENLEDEGIGNEDVLPGSQAFIQDFIEKIAEEEISILLGPIPTTSSTRTERKRDSGSQSTASRSSGSRLSGEQNVPNFDVTAYINERRGSTPEERTLERNPEQVSQRVVRYWSPHVPEPPRSADPGPSGSSTSRQQTPPASPLPPARRGYWNAKKAEEEKLQDAKAKQQYG